MVPLEHLFGMTFAGIAAVAAVAVVGVFAVGRGVGSFRGFPRARAQFEFDGGGRTAALDRGRRVRGTVLLPRAIARRGASVTVRVTDSFGRELLDKTTPVPGGPGRVDAIPVDLAVPAVIAQRHVLDVLVRAAGGEVFATRSEFLYRLDPGWDDYLPTLWHRPEPKNVGVLREMYLAGTQWLNSSRVLPDHFIDANYRYYLEHGFRNVYSVYHRSFAGEVAVYHNKARRAFLADRTNLRNLEREPCLSHPIVREEIASLFRAQAKMHRDYRPLYHSIADEPGIADQAAAFDFCFSPHCRAAFVKWLRKRYRSLAALNAQWGTDYRRWDDVRGELTDEAIARDDENYSARCDHMEFMDDVLVDAYRLAGEAVRQEDPDGRLGMAGGQGPHATGGWDFWKLCQVFDVQETYYIGNNYELIRSFSPDSIPFHTSWGPNDPAPDAERHATWYLFIHGDRGLLLIRQGGCEYLDERGRYNANARTVMPLCRELSGGIGKLRIASQRADDPIALYHSQANLRVHWLREMRPLGDKWVLRNSSHERTENRYFRLRESWVKLIEDNGYQYRFLCPPQVDGGALKYYNRRTGEGFKVLILPEILTLSAREARAIRAFVRAGGTVIADKLPGTFDEHGKRLPASRLAGLFDKGKRGRAILLDRDMLDYHLKRLSGGGGGRLKGLLGRHLVATVGTDRVTPVVTGRGGKPVTGVEVTVWHNGQAELIALHRNPLMRADELAPAGLKANKRFETPVRLTVTCTGRRSWYDVRAGKDLGVARQVAVTLDPWEPTFLLAAPAASARAKPMTVTVGGGRIRIDPGRAAGLATPTYHLDFIGPDGKERLAYRTNVTVKPSGESLPLPVALNDQAGTWTLAVREVATGRQLDVRFEVAGRGGPA